MAKFDKSWRDYEPPTRENRGRFDRDGGAGRSAQQDERGNAAESRGQGRSAGRRGARITANVCYVDPVTRAILEPAIAASIQKARAVAFSQEPPLERFQSEKEAKRFVYLLGEQDAERIHGLRRQVRYPLNVRRPDGIEETIAHYTDDFEYFEGPAPEGGGGAAAGGQPGCVVRYRADARRVIEDCKGMRTEMYKRSKKHFEAQYGIKIKET